MNNKELLKDIVKSNKAHDAIVKLYENGFDEDLIIELIVMGQLGQENKKSLKQKSANTMYDKTVSEYLVDQIKQNEIINQIELYSFEKYENHFLVILFPDEYQLEFIEKSNIFYDFDYLDNENKLKAKVPNTAGALYSVQLGVLEELRKREKQAKIMIIRYMKLSSAIGSKKLREINREIINHKIQDFEDIEELREYIQKNYELHYESFQKSIIYKEITKKSVIDYA